MIHRTINGMNSERMIIVLGGFIVGLCTITLEMHSFLLLAIPILIFLIIQSRYLLYSFLMFLPFTKVLSANIGGISFTIADLLVGFMFLVVFLHALQFKKISLENNDANKILLLKLFFIGLGFISSFYMASNLMHSPSLPAWALGENLYTIALSTNVRSFIPLFVLYIMFKFMNSVDKYKTTIKYTVIGSFLSCIYGVYEFIIKQLDLGFGYLLPGHANEILYFEGFNRLSGTFGEPGYFAGFIVISLILTLHSRSLKIFRQPFIICLLLVQIFCLVMTFSTVGMLSLILVLFILSLFRFKEQTIIILVPLAIFLFLVLQIEIINDVVSKPLNSESASSVDRSATAVAGFNMFLDYPILGIGPGNFGLLFNEYMPTWGIPNVNEAIANNVYVDLLSSYGVLGLILILGFIFILIRNLIHVFLTDTKRVFSPYMISALASLLVIVVAYPTYRYAFLWVVVSLLIVSKQMNDQYRKESQRL
ncbi:O-antigen ligase family protein [Alkalicoccobacillus porphyridii]|nr:O-antigen ligase family protein [Alkalicoccobacillus porphyridii]